MRPDASDNDTLSKRGIVLFCLDEEEEYREVLVISSCMRAPFMSLAGGQHCVCLSLLFGLRGRPLQLKCGGRMAVYN